jgi:hypothetical protein
MSMECRWAHALSPVHVMQSVNVNVAVIGTLPHAADFLISKTVQTGSGSYLSSYLMDSMLLSWGKGART